MTAELTGTAPDVAPLVDSFVSLMRTFKRAQARMMAAAENDLEWSAHLVLRVIAANGGPMRAADVAGGLHSDPSTVSRQVAALVKDQYLERQADPADGRASLLALTPRAHELLAEHDRIRLEYFARVLEGWSHDEVERFTELLQRFTAAYETTTTEWIPERIETRPARARSKP